MVPRLHGRTELQLMGALVILMWRPLWVLEYAQLFSLAATYVLLRRAEPATGLKLGATYTPTPIKTA